MATESVSAHEHDELEEVFSTMQESEAMVVQGLLESEGIEAMTISREAPQDVLPGVGSIAVLVNPEHAVRAREIISEQMSSGPEDLSEEEHSSEES